MRISVRAKARASKVSVKKLKDNSYTVSVTEPAEDGKANRGVIRALAKYFKISQSSVSLVSGHSAHVKIFEIQN